ncbi:MAG: hypothetical protein ABI566_06085 [Pseudolysinimonas sp.]
MEKREHEDNVNVPALIALVVGAGLIAWGVAAKMDGWRLILVVGLGALILGGVSVVGIYLYATSHLG